MTNDNHIPHPLWTVQLNFKRTLSKDLPEKLSDALEDLAVAVLLHNKEASDGDNWTVTLTTMGKPDSDEIYARIQQVKKGLIDKKGIIAKKLPEKDWLRHVHDNFPPLKIGKFFVYGSHHKGSKPKGYIPLKIDAATAFGSGEHETTKGCILALEGLKKEKASFKKGLDMGCGSGILAIAQAKLWPKIKVTAIDIDPESVTVTQRHAAMNKAEKNIIADAGNGYKAKLAQKNAPYDVVTANILANPLIEMAPDLFKALKPGGFAILSGLLKRQRVDVAAAQQKQGLRLIRAVEIGDWLALVLQKPSR